jgi:hypothetical protein
MIPVIEAAFRTGPMAAAGGPDRPAAGHRATRRRAIRVAAIARGADREEAAPPARFLAKRRVHNVGAATRSNWTRTSRSWHKERRLTRSVGASRRSPRVWRLKLQSLTSSATSVSLRGRTPKPKRPWTLTELWTRRRAHSSLQNCADAVSHKRPPPSSFVIRTPERKDGESSPDFYVSTWLATPAPSLADRGPRRACFARWGGGGPMPRSAPAFAKTPAGRRSLGGGWPAGARLRRAHFYLPCVCPSPCLCLNACIAANLATCCPSLAPRSSDDRK